MTKEMFSVHFGNLHRLCILKIIVYPDDQNQIHAFNILLSLPGSPSLVYPLSAWCNDLKIFQYSACLRVRSYAGERYMNYANILTILGSDFIYLLVMDKIVNLKRGVIVSFSMKTKRHEKKSCITNESIFTYFKTHLKLFMDEIK